MSVSFTREEILKATTGTAVGEVPERFDAISTDTRTLPKGALFVALRGETFDAHRFLTAAAAAGAGAALVQRGAANDAPAGFPLIKVDDTLVGLGHLGRAHRRRFSIPIGAITGSNGKTTTKEMIGAILAARGPALKTEGNLNNEVGVPLTLFRLEPSHTAAIIEMGMNHPGELARLSSYAEPCCAAITSISPAHLEGLGTVEAVAAAKGEIYSGLARDGLAIANADDPRVMEQARRSGKRLMTFGRASDADVHLAEIISHDANGLRIRILWDGRSWECRLRFVGEHNATNATAAFAMGIALGCTPEQCIAGLEASRPWAHRLALVDAPNGVTVIDDCYNANPASMSAALATLEALSGSRRRVAVLGDMLELGDSEDALHHELGATALERGVQLLVAYGPRSRATHAAAAKLGANALHVPATGTVDEAVSFLKARLAPGDVVLVKGSRGMRLERVVEALTGVSGVAH